MAFCLVLAAGLNWIAACRKGGGGRRRRLCHHCNTRPQNATQHNATPSAYTFFPSSLSRRARLRTVQSRTAISVSWEGAGFWQDLDLSSRMPSFVTPSVGLGNFAPSVDECKGQAEPVAPAKSIDEGRGAHAKFMGHEPRVRSRVVWFRFVSL